jgi:recombination protein RecA
VVTGNHVRCKVVKNKVAAPFREAEFDIMFDSGISREGDLLDLAIKDDIIKKSGAWFSYKDVRLGQGRENVKTFLKDNADLAEEVRTAVLAKRMAEADAPAKPAQPREGGKSEAQRAEPKKPHAAEHDDEDEQAAAKPAAPLKAKAAQRKAS